MAKDVSDVLITNQYGGWILIGGEDIGSYSFEETTRLEKLVILNFDIRKYLFQNELWF